MHHLAKEAKKKHKNVCWISNPSTGSAREEEIAKVMSNVVILVIKSSFLLETKEILWRYNHFGRNLQEYFVENLIIHNWQFGASLNFWNSFLPWLIHLLISTNIDKQMKLEYEVKLERTCSRLGQALVIRCTMIALWIYWSHLCHSELIGLGASS